MKRTFFFLLLVLSHILINWRSSESSIEGNFKHRVNFHGRLITHQGTDYRINNISVANQFKQIPMYDKPQQHAKPTMSSKTNRREILLSVNPKNHFIISKIDLSEVSEIRVPKPNITWVYQEEGKKRRLEFIEISVISKNRKKTKNSYLLDRKTKIRCDEINTAGPVEKIVPLFAIDRLIIEGYSLKNNVNNNTNNQNQKKNRIN